MKFSQASLPRYRLGTLIVFVALSAVVFTYLWTHSGGKLPVGGNHYDVTLQSDDLQNLVADSDVDIAGVKVGEVEKVSGTGKNATAEVSLDSDVVPLHQGATFALRSKTLVEETYVDITDGTGSALTSGSTLPLTANTSSVHLDQVLDKLTPQSRAALGDIIRTSGTATEGRATDIGALMNGLGTIGRQGHDALTALASQQSDLVTLSRNTAQVLADFDEQQGQAAHLVTVAQANMGATARQREQLARTVQLLPGVVSSARSAAPALQTLATDLRPLSASLRTAAPGVNQVLAQLPATTSELRTTFPTLSTVLRQAPPTLSRLPTFDSALSPLIPHASTALSNLDPMISYMSPYGSDFASFFSNVSSAFGLKDDKTHYARVYAILNSTSLVGDPLPTTAVGGVGENPYPRPHTAGHPTARFKGAYPHVNKGK